MWMTKVSINNPVFATMVMVAIVVMGLFSYKDLGLEQMPDVQIPGVFIETRYPGASPEQVENDVSKPIESVANTVSGVRHIYSSAFEGRATTWVEFELSANFDRGLQELRDKIAQVRPSFPRDVKDPFIVRGDNDNAQPVVGLSITSSKMSLRELSTLTDQVISKRLQAVPGVGRVNVDGTVVRQILISLNPTEMAAQNIGADEVVRAIAENNQDLPAGLLTKAETDTLVRVEGKIKNPSDFAKIIVARHGSAPILLGQVADVIDGEHEEQSISRINGQRAIGVSVIKVQDANIVKVGDGVTAALEELKSRLPADVQIKQIYSNANDVKDQLGRVEETILEGGALTILIVFMFLHSWRSTIITGLTLPISVIASFIALRIFGFTLNFMTLMALSLCIGLLIDDAIVVRENIVRHLGMGKSHRQAAADGTNEIGLAVMATTFAIVAVFVPVAFMKGIIGRFFLQFGITVAVSVLVSLFVSFTLDPMLSSVWPDPTEGRFKRFPLLGRIMNTVEHGVEYLHRVYGRVLDWALSHRKTTLGLAFSIFIGSFFLVHLIGAEFQPQVDQGNLSFLIKTRVGSSLAYTDSKAKQVEEILKSYPEIDIVNTVVGTNDGRNSARLDVKLTKRSETHRRSQQDLEADIRKRLAAVSGIESSVGYDNPIRVNIIGPEVDKLREISDMIAGKLAKIKGVTDIQNSLVGANPAIVVKVNNELASDLGLSVQQIGTALRPFVGGDNSGNWLGPDGQNYELNVQLPKSGREKISDLGDLMLASTHRTADGKPVMVPLRQVVQFVKTTSPQVIKRQDTQRRVFVGANVEGRPAGDAGKDVDAMLKEIKLPAGYRFDLGGQNQAMNESFGSAVGALGIAVIFIYLILASQFGSFLQPIAIMTSLPFSLVGVFLALLVTGSTLNVFSIIGFIMLMGLVTKNAILLVDFTNRRQREGLSQHDAILSAGQVRLRPILMTTLAMLFGMLPMAIGVGDGGEFQAPMGRAVIGGIITSTLLTLVVVPVAYTYLDSLGKWATRKFKGKEQHESEYDGGHNAGHAAAPTAISAGTV